MFQVLRYLSSHSLDWPDVKTDVRYVLRSENGLELIKSFIPHSIVTQLIQQHRMVNPKISTTFYEKLLLLMDEKRRCIEYKKVEATEYLYLTQSVAGIEIEEEYSSPDFTVATEEIKQMEGSHCLALKLDDSDSIVIAKVFPKKSHIQATFIGQMEVQTKTANGSVEKRRQDVYRLDQMFINSLEQDHYVLCTVHKKEGTVLSGHAVLSKYNEKIDDKDRRLVGEVPAFSIVEESQDYTSQYYERIYNILNAAFFKSQKNLLKPSKVEEKHSLNRLLVKLLISTIAVVVEVLTIVFGWSIRHKAYTIPVWAMSTGCIALGLIGYGTYRYYNPNPLDAAVVVTKTVCTKDTLNKDENVQSIHQDMESKL